MNAATAVTEQPSLEATLDAAVKLSGKVRIMFQNRAVSESKSLQRVRDYAKEHPITSVAVEKVNSTAAVLVTFAQGATCNLHFLSYPESVVWLSNLHATSKPLFSIRYVPMYKVKYKGTNTANAIREVNLLASLKRYFPDDYAKRKKSIDEMGEVVETPFSFYRRVN